MKKIRLSLLIAVFLCLITLSGLLSACSAGGRDFYAMGTSVNIRLSGSGSRKAYREIKQMLEDVEKAVSTELAASDLYRINRAPAGEAVAVGAETLFLFEESQKIVSVLEEICGFSAFDPSLYPLVKLWKLSPDTYSISAKEPPADTAIQEALALCGLDEFVADQQAGTITKLKQGAMLDFGGIAKGYAADRAKQIALFHGVKKGIINIGGNIYLLGKAYTVGITHPRPVASALITAMSLKDVSVVTSGDYERYYLDQNDPTMRYHHILDIRTGRPADAGIISATVIGERSDWCDALATACIVLGVEDSLALMGALNGQFGMSFRAYLVDGRLNTYTVGEIAFAPYE